VILPAFPEPCDPVMAGRGPRRCLDHVVDAAEQL